MLTPDLGLALPTPVLLALGEQRGDRPGVAGLVDRDEDEVRRGHMEQGVRGAAPRWASTRTPISIDVPATHSSAGRDLPHRCQDLYHLNCVLRINRHLAHPTDSRRHLRVEVGIRPFVQRQVGGLGATEQRESP